MKRILICGCSFSESMMKRGGVIEQPWIPYSDLLEKNYEQYYFRNTALSSAGQGEISEKVVHEVIRDDFNWDFVIVQWSAMGRGYSMSEKDWVERVMKENTIHMFHNSHEYIGTGLPEGQTSDQANLVSYWHYQSALSKIKLTQSFLEKNNIPYMFFWGWQQLVDKIYQEHRKLVDSVYDANWWYPGNKYHGLLQYIINEIGEERGVSSDGLHPSSEGHYLFYENILKPIFDKGDFNNLDFTRLI